MYSKEVLFQQVIAKMLKLFQMEVNLLVFKLIKLQRKLQLLVLLDTTVQLISLNLNQKIKLTLQLNQMPKIFLNYTNLLKRIKHHLFFQSVYFFLV